MRELEKEGLLDGHRETFNSPKVYRLSKLGREQYDVDHYPVSLTSGRIPHYLAISELFLDLRDIGNLHTYIVELREKFISSKGKEWIYSPDAFCVINNKACLFEIQLSERTSKRWKDKWEYAIEFFKNGHYRNASFQMWEGRVIKPRIVVLSNQQHETVLNGTEELQEHVKIHVVRNIEEFKSLI